MKATESGERGGEESADANPELTLLSVLSEQGSHGFVSRWTQSTGPSALAL